MKKNNLYTENTFIGNSYVLSLGVLFETAKY